MKDNSKIIDTHIGHKIRERRLQLHLSQGELGKMLSVSAQQVQRYESGENTIGLGKLVYLANALNVKPNYFMDELPLDEQIGHALGDVVTRGINRPLRILLVDDDTNDVLLFQNAITKHNHQAHLHHLQQSDQVLDYLAKCDKGSYPDIVILDINMPRVSGIDVLQKIKASHHKKVPVIMMTNSIRAKDMLACYEHYASGFIQKSADLQQFYNDVERIVSYWSGMVVLPSAA